jgi:Na+-driven multidrug efflux pump
MSVLSNVQLFILLSFLNSKYNSDKYIINSIGALNTLLNLIIYPIQNGFCMFVELRGSLAFGALKNKQFSRIIHRTRIVGNVFLLIMMSLFFILHKYVFQLMKYDTKQSEYMYQMLILKLVSIFFEFEFNLMFRVVLIVGKGIQGMCLLIIHAVMSVLYSFLILRYVNIGIYAIGLTFIAIYLTSCITTWSYILIFGDVNKKILKFSKDIWNFNKMLDYSITSLVLCGLSILDSADNETMSLMASFLDMTSFSSYNIIYSINIITSCVSSSFYITTNIVMSQINGEKILEKLKVYFFYIVYTGMAFSLFVICLTAILRDVIISIVVSNSISIATIAKSIFPFILFTIILETINNIFRNAVKSLGKLLISFIFTIIVVILNTAFIYYFTFVLNFGVFGVYYGYITYLLSSIIIFGIILYSIDWKESMKETNVSLIEIKKQ